MMCRSGNFGKVGLNKRNSQVRVKHRRPNGCPIRQDPFSLGARRKLIGIVHARVVIRCGQPDTLVVDRGVTASIVLHKLSGFHSHCDRSLFGPLRHLFSNVPHVPPGPLNYDAANGDFTEWLQTTNQPLKVRSARGLLDRVYVCHGIFSTHLGPICDALGIERPPPADLAKRKISQADLRRFVETSRRLVRAAAVLVAAYAAAVVLLRAILLLPRAAYSAMAAGGGI